MNRRRFLRQAALGLGAGVLARGLAQGGVANVPVNLFQEIGRRGGTLTLPLGSTPQSWNYFAVIDNFAYTVLNNVFDRLMQLDQISFELVGVLAESWSISKDARTTTVKLRSGIKWSDGIPFTPDLLEPEQAQAHSGRWAAEARAYAQAQLQTCWLYPRHNLAV